MRSMLPWISQLGVSGQTSFPDNVIHVEFSRTRQATSYFGYCLNGKEQY